MTIQRRQYLKTGLLAGISMSTPSVWAQNTALRSTASGLMVGQIADVSNAYQDISKDFIIGSRTA
jgi:hypothetical protein